MDLTEAGLPENKTQNVDDFINLRDGVDNSSQANREHVDDPPGNSSMTENPVPLTETTIDGNLNSTGIGEFEDRMETVSDEEELLQGPEDEDGFSGRTLDSNFQYPIKKFNKYSTSKYGKVKIKSKPYENNSNGELPGEKKYEALKVVEEKVNINISIADNADGGGGGEGGIAVSESTESPNASSSAVATPTSASSSSTYENFIHVDVNNETGILGHANVTNSEDSGTKNENFTVATSSSSSSSPSSTVGFFNFTDFLNVEDNEKDDVEEFKNESLVIENKVEESVIQRSAVVEPFLLKNRVAAATSSKNFEFDDETGLNAGSVTGITLGILVIFALFGTLPLLVHWVCPPGAISFVFYRRRYLNKPQVLHDKCSNLDSSGYIDDTSLRENSEEMYSLDNDSFLNSLEAMTIQNYWTESVKHTKL
ncbi:hypothetical protein Phum_PHUM616120 [Pediculus humanus corporis]|uniref:Uncharacterized protein n=1 Tax=Pediculus humanus subsp. corporis TaxID=121224 RepID=E0W479_PEDHC|nr:uncharacterized protein Phum_PHUM616120 [Pediculus humanus corporis]EEB20435.1 hypothetical protein Phum_PHUM616120 [Pediculus humanus corporis]